MENQITNKLEEMVLPKCIEPIDANQQTIETMLFSPGPTFHYVIDLLDGEIKYVHENIAGLLGLKDEIKIDDLLQRVHPADLSFVAWAEVAALKYLRQHVGAEKVKFYKITYCLRYQCADEVYKLFQCQALALTTDEKGNVMRSLHVMSDISHLAEANNYKVSLLGLMGEPSHFDIDLRLYGAGTPTQKTFTKREKDIINLIAKGLRNKEIADTLFISLHTVKNHRKNILYKARAKSSSELVASYINKGFSF